MLVSVRFRLETEWISSQNLLVSQWEELDFDYYCLVRDQSRPTTCDVILEKICLTHHEA